MAETDYERLSRIQGEATANQFRVSDVHGNNYVIANSWMKPFNVEDVLWLCAELRNTWDALERARATAAGLALEPSAYDIGAEQ